MPNVADANSATSSALIFRLATSCSMNETLADVASAISASTSLSRNLPCCTSALARPLRPSARMLAAIRKDQRKKDAG
jgi:hypothetical protein